MKTKAFKYSVLVLLIFVFGAMTVFGQELPVDPDEASTLIEEFISGILNLVYLPIAAPLVLALTEVSKRVLPNFNLALQRLSWSVLVWVVYIVVARAGMTEQFNQVVPALATLVTVAFGMFVTPAASGKAYDVVRHSFAINPHLPLETGEMEVG